MSNHRPIHFYDAATPENVPSGVYAACYINGYAWSEAQRKRMERIFCVSVLPEAYWARFARCIDIERGAATPNDLVPFIKARRLHHDDATAYVNRSNWETCKMLCADAGIAEPFWWVATLDGTDITDAWACQRYGYSGYDLSVLHGHDNFVKP